MGLTQRQSECLAFIRSYVAEKGIAPTYDEIAAALGSRSKGHIAELLGGLENRGHIRVIPAKARSIEILSPDSITLNPEIARLVRSYAEQEGIQKIDTAANELLRQVLGAAA